MTLPAVLVVDDEKNMRLSLKTMLSDDGYAVQTAESAEEAQVLMTREKFFMVITDARLGGMTGYEFLANLHKLWPETPALMISTAIPLVSKDFCSWAGNADEAERPRPALSESPNTTILIGFVSRAADV